MKAIANLPRLTKEGKLDTTFFKEGLLGRRARDSKKDWEWLA